MNGQFVHRFLEDAQPSRVIEHLAARGSLDPEIQALVDTYQDDAHHPEGSAYIHALMVIDFAAIISDREGLNDVGNAILRLAALTHDFGKPATTIHHADGRITAYGHPEAGILPATRFMQRSNISGHIVNHVLPLVREHMAHIGFYTPDITTRSVRRLMQRIEPNDIHMLAWLIEADYSGRGGNLYGQGLPARMKEILHVAENINTLHRPDHLVTGDDIMRVFNIQPSPLLGKVKNAVYQAQLDGKFTTREQGIVWMMNHVRIQEG